MSYYVFPSHALYQLVIPFLCPILRLPQPCSVSACTTLLVSYITSSPAMLCINLHYPSGVLFRLPQPCSVSTCTTLLVSYYVFPSHALYQLALPFWCPNVGRKSCRTIFVKISNQNTSASLQFVSTGSLASSFQRN